jgi:hypothetical protein
MYTVVKKARAREGETPAHFAAWGWASREHEQRRQTSYQSDFEGGIGHDYHHENGSGGRADSNRR